MNLSFFPFSLNARFLHTAVRLLMNGRLQNVLAAETSEPNADIVIAPKGTGSFQLSPTDNTVAGGNVRGNNAIDLQLTRTFPDQVASGNNSVLIGSSSRTSAVSGVTIGTGIQNIAANAVVIGIAGTASASGSSSIVLSGVGVTTNGANSVGIGNNLSVNGLNAVAIGSGLSDRGTAGAVVFGSGRIAIPGDTQHRMLVLRRVSTSATPVVLTTNIGTPALTNMPVLPNNSTFLFWGYVVARREAALDESAAYFIRGCIDRNSTAASTAFVGTPTVTTIAEDIPAWNVTLSVDTTLGALSIAFVGEAGKNIRATCLLNLAEVVA